MNDGNKLIVIKRDGRPELFDKKRIYNAIIKAFVEVDGEETEYAALKATDIMRYISRNYMSYFKENGPMHVEKIQDIIEDKLMSCNRKDVAKAFIRYRYLRKLARDKYKDMMDAVEKKVNAKEVENQNANVDEYSFGGRLGEVANLIMKQYALDHCVSKMARENHLNNMVYIHDLSHYPLGDHNCLSVPFDDLLANGFSVRQTDVRPAQSVNTAMQLVAVIFQIQSLQQFGGVSATHLDWTMVPYVRKSFYKHFKDGLKYLYPVGEYRVLDDFDPTILSIEDEEYTYFSKAHQYAMEMTEREVRQAVEGLYHNLNTLQSRSGNQLPFTSINYGTCTEPEGRMIIKALLEVSIKGIGKLHRTPIFPCGIFQLKEGLNRKPGDPNYDLFKLALKSTAQRLYPNYANVDWSGNTGYDPNDHRTYFSTMGCRTANGWDINGFGQLKDGRGNICPVTIILPTLAKESVDIDSNNAVEIFMDLLDQKLFEARDMLIERFEWICSQPSDSAKFMYENNVMAGYVPEEGIRSALKHGTLALGMLGLAEALQLLVGCNHINPIGMDLAKRICALYKKRCAEFKEQEKLNFGVYFTPAENLCYTAMQRFKAKYGEIPNVSDKDFFTNSMHVPVWEHVSMVEKINIESELTGYSSAGCITYLELPSTAKNNLEALEQIVNYAMDKDIPYFAINVPNDMCMGCGYTDEIGEVCPVCGGTDIRRLRRITGYLTGDYTTAFNLGKQQEVNMRVKHAGGEA